MNILIRPASSDDANTIADFNAAMAWETERLVLDPATIAQGVRAVLLDRSKGLYFVAEVDGKIAGQMMVTFEWSDWRNGEIWWIQSVYVAAEFRRRGVFRAIYEHVRSESLTQSAVGLRLYVASENRDAQKTYEAMGMKLSHYMVMEEIFSLSSREN